MTKQQNRKPVALFNFKTGNWIKGTAVGKLRALVFNLSPEDHNPTLDLIKTRMSADEVLQFIEHCDRNPSEVRMYQLLKSLMNNFSHSEALLDAALLLQKRLLEEADIKEHLFETKKKELEEQREVLISDNSFLDDPEGTLSAQDITDHYEVLYNRLTDDFRLPRIKTNLKIISSRLLLRLGELFRQGVSIDEAQDIFIEAREEADNETQELYARYKVSEAEHAQIFGLVLSRNDMLDRFLTPLPVKMEKQND